MCCCRRRGGGRVTWHCLDLPNRGTWRRSQGTGYVAKVGPFLGKVLKVSKGVAFAERPRVSRV